MALAICLYSNNSKALFESFHVSGFWLKSKVKALNQPETHSLRLLVEL